MEPTQSRISLSTLQYSKDEGARTVEKREAVGRLAQVVCHRRVGPWIATDCEYTLYLSLMKHIFEYESRAQIIGFRYQGEGSRFQLASSCRPSPS